MGSTDRINMISSSRVLAVTACMVAAALTAPTRKLLAPDPEVCQDTTVEKPLCHICIDTKWTSGSCQGINQMNCYKRKDQSGCEADGKCSWFEERKTCNDINAPNCPSAAVNIQGCIDYVTREWKSGNAECDQTRVGCENCTDGDCVGGPAPTPPTPTPPSPPTPTPPSPPTPGKTCPWDTATVACKTDADCGAWASTNCQPNQVTYYCRDNGFCHFQLASLYVS